MPFLSDNRSLAAGAVVNNVLDGKFGRVLLEPSKVSFALTASVVTGFATILLGDQVLMDDQEIPDTAAAPRNPEDLLAQSVGAVGEEAIVRLRNANAGANVIRTSVFIEPI